MTRPALYLDLEGTLLLLAAGGVYFRPHLEELLEFVQQNMDRMDCFWLTSFSRRQVESIFHQRGYRVEGIRYQEWNVAKTECLVQRGGPCFWVDDRIQSRNSTVLEALQKAEVALSFHSIPRWDGSCEDRELLTLRRRIREWLQSLEEHGDPEAVDAA